MTRKSTWIVTLLGLAAIGGCSENKMTRCNFDMIREGASNRDEVRLTLGDKFTDLGNQWEYEDKAEHLHATIHFDDQGVVVRKEWMDGRSGEWTGAAPGIDEQPHDRDASQKKSYGTIKKN